MVFTTLDETVTGNTSTGFPRLFRLAFSLCLLLLGLQALPAMAVDCSDFPNGVIDGATGTPAPDQIQIDRNCIIRNYPESNPLGTNFSFYTSPGQTDERWIAIFDNVYHTGQMACNDVAGHKIWFVNGSSTSIQEGCQNFLIPVEKIEKQNPAGMTTATIGVPFTYRLTMPVLFDPGTGEVVNTTGSPNDLHAVTLTDDLNATGAVLTYLDHVAYWADSGTAVPHTFVNAGGVLTFSEFSDSLSQIPWGKQIIIEVTVVLEDAPANIIGTDFVNVAKWDFGRLIDGEFFEPLPGEWGISEPMTIGGPDLTLTKSGPATLNLGQWGNFSLDIQNIGNSDAWNTAILDRLPDDSNGGMCDETPTVLAARVFAADGVTPVPGKGPLVAGTDFLFGYSGAPTCELSFSLLSAASVIGPNERLIINYQTRLDADTENGAVLTNVAAATHWSNDDAGNSERQTYVQTMTNGSVGTLDHEDAHTVTTALTGYFFEKTVANLSTGLDPAGAAAPGDRLRYSLRLRTTDSALNNFRFQDDLGALNALPVFAPGTLTLVGSTIPAGAITVNTNPNGGTNGAGLLDIRNLNLPAASELEIQFDITLAPSLPDATVVTNQADLISATILADSDDPNINGVADPDVPGDEDPTRIVIEAEPPAALVKANTQASATIGQEFRYRITVPAVAHTAPLYDVRILDNLLPSAADMQFVDVIKISGSGSWAPVNTGTVDNIIIDDFTGGIDIPAGEQVVIEIAVRLLDTPTNVAGLSFSNTASFSYNLFDNDDSTEQAGGAGSTGAMTIVEPQLTLEKSGPPLMRAGQPGTFSLNVHNIGNSPAYGASIDDRLPNTVSGGMCDAAPAQVSAGLFAADGVTPLAPALSQGTDYSVIFNGDPACTFTVSMLTSAASIGPDQRLIITYEASLDAATDENATLTNVAGVTRWSSADIAVANDQARLYTEVLTDGTPGLLDHQDAHTAIVFSPLITFEKTVVNLSTGENPATSASPGDRLGYRLYIENVGDIPVADFNLVDELDRLNASPAFQPGTLTLGLIPAGAQIGNTDPFGGASGTGRLDFGNLNLDIGESLVITFEVQLAPVIANDSYVSNQSQMLVNGFTAAESDDPEINGSADPQVANDEDPTRVQIESAPLLDIDKISIDLSGDPDVLMAGETLRYRISVQNIGNDNAANAILRDQIPAGTTYVANSSRLNGIALADSGGTSPLVNGIALNSPRDATPGFLPADAGNVTDNIATVEFEVVVSPDLLDGSIISNQSFVNVIAAGISDQPSDDPGTNVVDDPTQNVVGNFPLLFAQKSVALQIDGGTPGIVDPGDTLRYTIMVLNNGAIAATNVILSDSLPANTVYVSDSTTLNGLAVGQPDGGVLPLAAGIAVSSSDLTPPLPGAGEGTLTAGEFATVQFDLVVADDTQTGTLISNQARVSTNEVGNLLTDGDGDPATGPEPTVVVVGDSQQLAITKQVSVVGGGPALAGATLEYALQVTNIGAVPAYDIVVTDNLDDPLPGQLSFVPGSAVMNGAADGIVMSGNLLTASYGLINGALQPGERITVRFQALIDSQLAMGTTIVNRAVATWNGSQTVEATVAVDVGGVPGTGTLNGSAWHDLNFDNSLDANEPLLEGWTVELYRNNQLVTSTQTDADGAYSIRGITPNNVTGDSYRLAFVAPGAGPNTASLGEASSPGFTNGMQEISDIVVLSGNNLLNLDLPIEPNGVVFDSVARTPVAGATLTLVNTATGTPLPAGCLDDPRQQNQVTAAGGHYKFDLNFSSPSCPDGAVYSIQVIAPASGFIAGYSQIIPPATSPAAPFAVPGCPGTVDDAIPATNLFCEAQTSDLPPGIAVAAQSQGTSYHVHLQLSDDNLPGSGQIYNNHIPLDPILEGALSISKTTPMVNVDRGQLVPYVITVNNTYGLQLQNVNVVDRFPPGFHYIEGSARLDGEAVEPIAGSRELVWNDLTLAADSQHTIKMLLGVGAGVSEGEFTNRAQAMNSLTGGAMSGEASATVRLVPDPSFDCTDVIGKVYDDQNLNGQQDNEEAGIANVRVVTTRGLAATTDTYGRFHFTCPIVPHADRGSNFALKLDDRTLPSGYRPSTDLLRVQRATRGKTLRFDFGASIHRVVGLDIADDVFAPDTTDIRPQWLSRFSLLMEELQKGPSVLRLSYLADVEDPNLVEKRLRVVRKRIDEEWSALACCYRLVIEPEIFWRLGGPAEQAIQQKANSK